MASVSVLCLRLVVVFADPFSSCCVEFDKLRCGQTSPEHLFPQELLMVIFLAALSKGYMGRKKLFRHASDIVATTVDLLSLRCAHAPWSGRFQYCFPFGRQCLH